MNFVKIIKITHDKFSNIYIYDLYATGPENAGWQNGRNICGKQKKERKMRNVNFAKKPVLVFLLLFAAGAVFADDTEDADEQIPLPKNTITIDVGPTAYFLMLTGIMNLIDPDYSPFAIGIAAQYERQITEKVSMAGRFEYGMIDMSDNESKWYMSSISAEVHGRYYPMQGTFFLGGMIGYANVFMDNSTVDTERKSLAHYFKFGGKLGWRIDFGKPGGFVLEPALGYYGAIGTAFKTGYEKDFPVLGNLLNLLNSYLARGLFIEGPRLSLGLGYRF
ncbi:MAG: hypothetical protein LBH97_07825 [Treponema sp.]|jgi:hypothetical protein|nr:hypothetical protein [Treponema sp.]